ncbi:MAG: VOC family protein [Planctomycetota bacterium]|nr:VOC family protein [Planctomycetota bacterium]
MPPPNPAPVLPLAISADQGTQRVVPYLVYRDCPAAIEFLTKAFGFEERFRFPLEDGSVGHAELGVDENTVIYVASAVDAMGHSVPKDNGKRQGLVCVYVADCDAAYEQVKAAGATISSEPEDQFYGDRSYRAIDPEGYDWNFSQHVKEFDPSTMAPPA